MFETTLSSFRARGAARRKLAAMPVALVVHALALAGVGIAQLWAVSAVPEPVLMTELCVTLPPPPPPPPPPPSGNGTEVKPAMPRAPEQETQPRAIPTAIPTPGPITASGPGVPGGVGGVGGRKEGGIVGGADKGTDGGHVSTEVPIRPEPEGPVVPGGEVLPPVLLHRTEPIYPEVARHAGVFGTVIATAVIDTDGNVVNVSVMRSLGLGCSEAAVDAIQTWKYLPATRHGRPVAVYLTVTVRFELQR
jgi:periplasmic protein TonB